jgi:excisionase family DNA binding protein
MNLAEAIRKAALEHPSAPALSPDAQPSDHSTLGVKASVQVAETLESGPSSPHAHVASGNVVRLELFLSAEQMSGMLRAILHGQHSVLTLSEAAAYLRVRPHALARLAEDGLIPGFQIDGRWRFTKSSLDEWLAQHDGQFSEEAHDVA